MSFWEWITCQQFENVIFSRTCILRLPIYEKDIIRDYFRLVSAGEMIVSDLIHGRFNPTDNLKDEFNVKYYQRMVIK